MPHVPTAISWRYKRERIYLGRYHSSWRKSPGTCARLCFSWRTDAGPGGPVARKRCRSQARNAYPNQPRPIFFISSCEFDAKWPRPTGTFWHVLIISTYNLCNIIHPELFHEQFVSLTVQWSKKSAVRSGSVVSVRVGLDTQYSGLSPILSCCYTIP
jgi:hypothetical protein